MCMQACKLPYSPQGGLGHTVCAGNQQQALPMRSVLLLGHLSWLRGRASLLSEVGGVAGAGFVVYILKTHMLLQACACKGLT